MSTRNSEIIREASCSQNTPLCLIDLPDDILYTIFSYCDGRSLGRICRTCSKFKELASQDCVWIRVFAQYENSTCVEFVNTRTNSRNSKLNSAQKRKGKKSLKERLRISRNWETKAYKSTRFVRHSTRLIPWLRLDGQDLYVSKATDIHCYKVNNDGTILEAAGRKLSGSSCDVTRFVISGDMLVSGFRGGGIIGFNTKLQQRKFEYRFNECGDTQTVAFHDDVVIAGFRDGSVKVIKTKQSGDDAITHLNNILPINKVNRVWSSAIAPDASSFAIGNAGHESNRSPLELHDLESCKIVQSLGSGWMRGAGILDIKYETPNIMLTCGYDTSLRLWDLRTPACVKKWDEPFDAELSCLQSDDNNVIVTGTFQYGVTRLWDKRFDSPVQLYYVGKKRSPVYSLDTDFKKLFVALDFEIHMLDFSI